MNTITSIANVLYHKGLTEEEFKQQMKSVKQIELVSMQAGISLKDVDILKLFGTGDEKLPIITDAKEINKRLFDHHELNKSAIKRANVEELIKMEKRLKTYHQKYFIPALQRAELSTKHEINSLTNDLDRREKHLMKLNQELAVYKKDKDTASVKYTLQDIASIQKNLELYKLSLENNKKGLDNIQKLLEFEGFLQALVKVTLGGFWKLIDMKKDKLLFITTNDVILFNKNKKSGLNVQLNFGILCCEFNLLQFAPEITPFINNIKSGGNIHPYCNQRGSVCMGNAWQAYENHRTARDLNGCMALLANIMSAYSDAGGPHKPLSYFIDDHYKMEPSAAAKKYLKKKNESISKRVEALLRLAEDNKQAINAMSKSFEPEPPNVDPEEEFNPEDEEELESEYFEEDFDEDLEHEEQIDE
jgi:hypothetical protein